MRPINSIIIHCADTPDDMDIGVDTIRKWHVEERGWSDVGYHYIIKRDGETEVGRPIETVGAHAKGHNSDSIGICLVGGKGGFNFTLSQMQSLEFLLEDLTCEYPRAEVIGHRDVDRHKTCPNFNVKAWWD